MEAPIPFDPTLDIEAVDLGRMSYDAALSAQRAEQDALLVSRPSRRRMKVFLVEHDAVITISRRPEARAHLLATPEMLATLGIAVAEITALANLSCIRFSICSASACACIRMCACSKMRRSRHARSLVSSLVETQAALARGLAVSKAEWAKRVVARSQQSACVFHDGSRCTALRSMLIQISRTLMLSSRVDCKVVP